MKGMRIALTAIGDLTRTLTEVAFYTGPGGNVIHGVFEVFSPDQRGCTRYRRTRSPLQEMVSMLAINNESSDGFGAQKFVGGNFLRFRTVDPEYHQPARQKNSPTIRKWERI
jgi:hypothetical protein